jgi:hypothetical protein
VTFPLRGMATDLRIADKRRQHFPRTMGEPLAFIEAARRAARDNWLDAEAAAARVKWTRAGTLTPVTRMLTGGPASPLAWVAIRVLSMLVGQGPKRGQSSA